MGRYWRAGFLISTNEDSMKLLSVQDIAAAQDLPEKTVDVPEWNGSVRLVCLPALDRAEWEKAAFVSKDNVDTDNFFYGLLRRSMRDESGAPLFVDDEAVKVLGQKNKDVLMRLHAAALELNGIGAESAKEIQKNSEASQADAGSGS